jgi:hypothetical protein
MTEIDRILWNDLGISDRAVLVDTRDGEPVGAPVTGDRLERYQRGNIGGVQAEAAWMNEREEGERFRVVLLPPR